MGVCASKMKEMSTGIDKEQIEMGVKSKRVDISERAQALVQQWQQRINNGEKVEINQMELLPQKEVKDITLVFTSQNTPKQLLKTAIYVTTNTLYRDKLKKDIWADLAAGMKAKKMPDAVIQHGEKGAGPVVDIALDKQVAQMAQAAEEGRPLVTEEEAKAVQEYNAKIAAQNAKKDGNQVDNEKVVEGDQSKPINNIPVGKDTGDSGVVPQDGQRYEQNTSIRAQ